jgi:hypothetical protein
VIAGNGKDRYANKQDQGQVKDYGSVAVCHGYFHCFPDAMLEHFYGVN